MQIGLTKSRVRHLKESKELQEDRNTQNNEVGLEKSTAMNRVANWAHYHPPKTD